MRFLSPSELPWQRPRRELLLLALVAAASLSIVYPVGAQDVSRMCLTQALTHGHLSADQCLAGSVDHADYGGHRYSDKGPGLSALAVPVAELVGLRIPADWHHSGELRLWAVRVATGGVALLLCAFLLGRIAEGLVPGTGGATLVAFALGTEASALAAANFAHVPAAALAFCAFVLAWSRRPFWAGLVVGVGVLVEYEAGLVALILGAYVVLRGARAVGRYAAGVLPAAVVLGAYNTAAFGSPFHLSYRYVASGFAADQAAGFFGIHPPSWHAARLVLVGDRGLLFDSPFLLAAAFGLVLLARRLPAEVTVCALVIVAFGALDIGYFDPYGGDSPGARFLIPALPFVVLGLPAAFQRLRAVTAVLVAASVVASTAIALTWPAAVNSFPGYRDTVWRRLQGIVQHGSSDPLAAWAQKNVLDWAGVHPLGASLVAFALALAALTVSFAELRRV